LFERIGCDSNAGDISPAAALLTWVSMNVLGGGEKLRERVTTELTKVFDEMTEEVRKLGIETRKDNGRGYVYFYCNEIVDPNSGWKIPLASNWVIDGGTGTYAKLVPHPPSKSFKIEIIDGGSAADLKIGRCTGYASMGPSWWSRTIGGVRAEAIGWRAWTRW
jgi:hypothetical protein